MVAKTTVGHGADFSDDHSGAARAMNGWAHSLDIAGFIMAVLAVMGGLALLGRRGKRARLAIPAPAASRDGSNLEEAAPLASTTASTSNRARTIGSGTIVSLGTIHASGALSVAAVPSWDDVELTDAAPSSNGKHLAPGWRHDPQNRGDFLRYWDGAAWTEFFARPVSP